MYIAPVPCVQVYGQDGMPTLPGPSSPLKIRARDHRPKSNKASCNTHLERTVLLAKLTTVVGGCLLTFAGVYTLYPISRSLLNVPLTALKLYLAFFGLCAVMLEGKAILPEHSGLRQWFYTEFHFLAAPRGKAFFYWFVGILCLSLHSEHFLFLILGILIMTFGCINFIASVVSRHQLRAHGLSPNDFQTSQPPTKRSRAHRHHHYREDLVDENPPRGLSQAQPGLPSPFEIERQPFLVEGGGAEMDYLNRQPLPPMSQLDTRFEMASYTDPLKTAALYAGS